MIMDKNNEAVADLLSKAKSDLLKDMENRDLGAVIWDLSDAGFHYLPELSLPTDDPENPEVVGITGIYRHNGTLYLILEGKSDISVDEFYDKDNEVRPVVVTLTPDKAAESLGNPEGSAAFSADADLEEWLAVADCYFEALAE